MQTTCNEIIIEVDAVFSLLQCHPQFCFKMHILVLKEMKVYMYIILNHPYGTFSKFPEQAKEK